MVFCKRVEIDFIGDLRRIRMYALAKLVLFPEMLQMKIMKGLQMIF